MSLDPMSPSANMLAPDAMTASLESVFSVNVPEAVRQALIAAMLAVLAEVDDE